MMLSILIIDDTPEKITKLKSIIEEFKDFDICCDIVNDTKNALAKLEQSFYDLILLDMFIPFEWGNDINPKNALQFIEQLNQDEDLHYPLSILAITKKEDLSDDIVEKLQKKTVSLLQYKEDSEIWKSQLRNNIKSIIGAKKSLFSRNEYYYDVVILTALQNPEFEKIKEELGGLWTLEPIIGDESNNYYRGEFCNKKGQKIKCIITYAKQMASIASAALTTKLIYNFRPKYLFMTGIAAGINNANMNYGDILVASEVWDGASGKIKSDKNDGNAIFEPDYRHEKISPTFEAIISRLKDSKELLHQIEDGYKVKTGKPQSQLQIHLGPMASVPAVLSCSDEISKIKSHQRKLQGIEMETYGMFYAAANAIKPLPKIVASLKSVSDFANVKKNDNYQEYAAYTSAALLKHILINELEY